jgi:hypothetical protein
MFTDITQALVLCFGNMQQLPSHRRRPLLMGRSTWAMITSYMFSISSVATGTPSVHPLAQNLTLFIPT